MLCPLNTFLEIIATRVVENPSVDCQKQIQPVNLLMSMTFLMSFGFALVASMLIILLTIETYRKIFRNKANSRLDSRPYDRIDLVHEKLLDSSTMNADDDSDEDNVHYVIASTST